MTAANDKDRAEPGEPESPVEWAERMPEFGPDTIIRTGDQSRAEIERLLGNDESIEAPTDADRNPELSTVRSEAEAIRRGEVRTRALDEVTAEIGLNSNPADTRTGAPLTPAEETDYAAWADRAAREEFSPAAGVGTADPLFPSWLSSSCIERSGRVNHLTQNLPRWWRNSILASRLNN